MPPKKGGLGRGFNALFEDNAAASLSDENNIAELLITDIEPNREQPRRSFDEKALEELADSIKEHGLIQPIIVKPVTNGSYMIVAGERRWRAARLAGLSKVPVIVRALDDREVALVALIENLQREDLNAIEEAQGIKQLIDAFELTQEQAASRLGVSRPAVTNALRLMTLPEEVLQMVRDGSLSAGHARALLSLDDKTRTKEIADELYAKKLSVRDAESLIKTINANSVKKPRGRRQPPRAVFYDEAELAMTQALGRKVKVKNAKKGGVLEIEYFDDEDLSKLCNKMENTDI